MLFSGIIESCFTVTQMTLKSTLPLKQKGVSCAESLLRSLNDFKALIPLNFLNINNNNIKVVLFGLTRNCGATPVDVGSLAPHETLTISNLGVKNSMGILSLRNKISHIIRPSPFPLSKAKPVLLRQEVKRWHIRLLLNYLLDKCSSLYNGISLTLSFAANSKCCRTFKSSDQTSFPCLSALCETKVVHSEITTPPTPQPSSG